ncbi:MAG: hypothetical protein H8E31_05330 [Planctomycetes bacterium]|nr:hypothetical protein [Planctomycetota bacterium]
MLRTTLPLLALAVLLLPSSAPAQTTVPGGDVSGTWPLGGSPYLIDGDIAVPLGSVLILEPGVELIFQDWYELAVYGQLRAVGRVDAPVVFTSTPPGPGEPGWRGLGFYSATLFTMPGQGGGVFHEGYFLEVHNSIVWGNLHGQLEGDAATVRFSDVGGGYPGAGNLDADPRFVEPGAGDYHLRATSPCRDAADPAAAPPTDFEGDPRLATAQDQGADEFHRHLYVTGDYQAGAALTVRLIGDPGSTPAVAAAGSRILDPPRTTVFGDLYLGNILRQLDLGTVPASGVVGAVVTLPAILPAVLALQGRVADRLTNLAVLLRD